MREAESHLRAVAAERDAALGQLAHVDSKLRAAAERLAAAEALEVGGCLLRWALLPLKAPVFCICAAFGKEGWLEPLSPAPRLWLSVQASNAQRTEELDGAAAEATAVAAQLKERERAVVAREKEAATQLKLAASK